MATSVAWIGDAATKIYALIEDARKADKEGKSFFGDNTLEMTQRLAQIAEALNKLQIGFRATHAKIKDANASLERFEEMDKATLTLTLVVNGLATPGVGRRDRREAAGVEAKPDAKSAEAWADSVVDASTTSARSSVRSRSHPGSASSRTCGKGSCPPPSPTSGSSKGHDEGALRGAGPRDRADQDYHQFLRTGETVVWKGPACPMVQDAWFFDQNLQNWMVQLQKDKGFGATDLYVYAPRELATLLLDRLQGSSQSEETKPAGAGGSPRGRSDLPGAGEHGLAASRQLAHDRGRERADDQPVVARARSWRRRASRALRLTGEGARLVDDDVGAHGGLLMGC